MEKKHYYGHRQRLRQRFDQQGLDGFRGAAGSTCCWARTRSWCFPYEPERVAEAGAHFDWVVARILAEDFAVRQAPEARVCMECDFRMYCAGQGTLKQKRGDNG